MRFCGLICLLVVCTILLSPGGVAKPGWLNANDPQTINVSCAKRNYIFYAGEPIAFKTDKPVSGYEVRSYWGDVVDKGKNPSSLKQQDPGWYKLYLYGAGDLGIKGSTMFVVLRNDSRFPPMAPPGTWGGALFEDEIVRGVMGMGPQRHRALSQPGAIKILERSLALDQKYYMPFDPVRQRSLLVAFPNGTKKSDFMNEVVRKFSGTVKNWEPRNEPNDGSSGAAFVQNELIPFYELVKSVDPANKVIAPGTVTIGPQMLGWLEDFFNAGGAKYIDGFSFHFYNNNNGDVFLLRKSMESLNALLKKYHAESLEKWQTEQGYFAACYGLYQPRLQSRWTMLQMMMFEQYGIPKEHNHLWYDVNLGFWAVPAWWENGDASINPAAVLMRIWAEELYGKKFCKAFDFGMPGNQLYVGDLFAGSEGSVAAFMSTGCTDGKVELVVNNARKLRVVSAFGVVREIDVHENVATLDVPEIPVYVELKPGQSISVVPSSWGPNLARQPWVKVQSSANTIWPNDVGKIVNGEFESWYWNFKPDSGPWKVEKPVFPVNVEIDLPKPQVISRVIVYASPPWQTFGSLLDYELQYDANGQWLTVDHVVEPPKTFKVVTEANKTSVDSFYSERWIFQHQFKPINTAKLRLVIHDVTCGGCSTPIAFEAGGQGSEKLVTIKEVELYGK